MYKISKEFAFSASHALGGLTDNHPCARVHGHNYVVVVELKSTSLIPPGFVLDYRKLDVVKNYIDTRLDHRHLNDVLDYNPTAENMAHFLFDEFYELLYPIMEEGVELSAVTISETPKTIARYERS